MEFYLVTWNSVRHKIETTHFYRWFTYINLLNIHNGLICKAVFAYSFIDEETLQIRFK